MNKNKQTALLTACMLLVPVAALAVRRTSAPTITTFSAGHGTKKASTTKPPIPPFDKVDTNGDHRIEWKEAQAVGVPKAIFDRYDYNHDGKLNDTEWKIVKIDMIHTSKLPQPESKSMPGVPASVAKKVHATPYSTAAGKLVTPPATSGSRTSGTSATPASAPVPSTGG